ncbi:MFS general substrate transporter [Aureobasidium subglaciale]|nr:MFS general substrate transporter [Aureobasidium subglaciale]
MADRPPFTSRPSIEDEESEMAPLHPASVHDLEVIESQGSLNNSTGHARIYKRRFFGLFQLVLLNIIVSWDWLTFSAVSSTAAQFFQVSESAINWLSTGFLFAFVAVTPFTIWALHRGPKTSIVISALLLFTGNWVRYAGTRVGRFGVVIFGQIIIGFSQPFVLAAPTRYSDLWFTGKGRVSATAIASLANPLGGALGQLIGPLWATKPEDVPDMVLYTAIIVSPSTSENVENHAVALLFVTCADLLKSCVACLPSFFIPSKPPTSPSVNGDTERLNVSESIQSLKRNKPFFLILTAFGVYVGFFNAVSSLINQIFEPYGFSETEAGIAGALLIVVGLVASAIVSPLVDRTKKYLLTIKLLAPLIAIGYLLLIFVPETRTVIGPYVVCALLGAASFSLLPCALEYLVEITYPASPEVSSTICWAGGQLLGAMFIIIMDALKGGVSGEPKATMKRALIFQAVISWLAVPCVFALNFLDKGSIGLRRHGAENISGTTEGHS